MRSFLIVIAVVLSSCGIKRAANSGQANAQLVPTTAYTFKTDSTGKVVSREEKVVYVPAPKTVIRDGKQSSTDVSIETKSASSKTIDEVDRTEGGNRNYHQNDSRPESGQYPNP